MSSEPWKNSSARLLRHRPFSWLSASNKVKKDTKADLTKSYSTAGHSAPKANLPIKPAQFVKELAEFFSNCRQLAFEKIGCRRKVWEGGREKMKINEGSLSCKVYRTDVIFIKTGLGGEEWMVVDGIERNVYR